MAGDEANHVGVLARWCLATPASKDWKTQIRAVVALTIGTSTSQVSWKGRNYPVARAGATWWTTLVAKGTGETRA